MLFDEFSILFRVIEIIINVLFVLMSSVEC